MKPLTRKTIGKLPLIVFLSLLGFAIYTNDITRNIFTTNVHYALLTAHPQSLDTNFEYDKDLHYTICNNTFRQATIFGNFPKSENVYSYNDVLTFEIMTDSGEITPFEIRNHSTGGNFSPIAQAHIIPRSQCLDGQVDVTTYIMRELDQIAPIEQHDNIKIRFTLRLKTHNNQDGLLVPVYHGIFYGPWYNFTPVKSEQNALPLHWYNKEEQ